MNFRNQVVSTHKISRNLETKSYLKEVSPKLQIDPNYVSARNKIVRIWRNFLKRMQRCFGVAKSGLSRLSSKPIKRSLETRNPKAQMFPVFRLLSPLTLINTVYSLYFCNKVALSGWDQQLVFTEPSCCKPSWEFEIFYSFLLPYIETTGD